MEQSFAMRATHSLSFLSFIQSGQEPSLPGANTGTHFADFINSLTTSEDTTGSGVIHLPVQNSSGNTFSLYIPTDIAQVINNSHLTRTEKSPIHFFVGKLNYDNTKHLLSGHSPFPSERIPGEVPPSLIKLAEQVYDFMQASGSQSDLPMQVVISFANSDNTGDLTTPESVLTPTLHFVLGTKPNTQAGEKSPSSGEDIFAFLSTQMQQLAPYAGSGDAGFVYHDGILTVSENNLRKSFHTSVPVNTPDFDKQPEKGLLSTNPNSTEGNDHVTEQPEKVQLLSTGKNNPLISTPDTTAVTGELKPNPTATTHENSSIPLISNGKTKQTTLLNEVNSSEALTLDKSTMKNHAEVKNLQGLIDKAATTNPSLDMINEGHNRPHQGREHSAGNGPVGNAHPKTSAHSHLSTSMTHVAPDQNGKSAQNPTLSIISDTVSLPSAVTGDSTGPHAEKPLANAASADMEKINPQVRKVSTGTVDQSRTMSPQRNTETAPHKVINPSSNKYSSAIPQQPSVSEVTLQDGLTGVNHNDKKVESPSGLFENISPNSQDLRKPENLISTDASLNTSQDKFRTSTNNNVTSNSRVSAQSNTSTKPSLSGPLHEWMQAPESRNTQSKNPLQHFLGEFPNSEVEWVPSGSNKSIQNQFKAFFEMQHPGTQSSQPQFVLKEIHPNTNGPIGFRANAGILKEISPEAFSRTIHHALATLNNQNTEQLDSSRIKLIINREPEIAGESTDSKVISAFSTEKPASNLVAHSIRYTHVPLQTDHGNLNSARLLESFLNKNASGIPPWQEIFSQHSNFHHAKGTVFSLSENNLSGMMGTNHNVTNGQAFTMPFTHNQLWNSKFPTHATNQNGNEASVLNTVVPDSPFAASSNGGSQSGMQENFLQNGHQWNGNQSNTHSPVSKKNSNESFPLSDGILTDSPVGDRTRIAEFTSHKADSLPHHFEVTEKVKKMIEQITSHIKLKFSQQKADISIRLQPESLGKLQVKMEIIQNVVHMTMVAEKQESKEILGKHIDHLKENLSQQGYRVEKVTIISQDEKASMQFQSDSSRNWGGHSREPGNNGQHAASSRNHVPLEPFDTENIEEPVLQRAKDKSRTIDLTV